LNLYIEINYEWFRSATIIWMLECGDFPTAGNLDPHPMQSPWLPRSVVKGLIKHIDPCRGRVTVWTGPWFYEYYYLTHVIICFGAPEYIIVWTGALNIYQKNITRPKLMGGLGLRETHKVKISLLWEIDMVYFMLS